MISGKTIGATVYMKIDEIMTEGWEERAQAEFRKAADAFQEELKWYREFYMQNERWPSNDEIAAHNND